MTRKLMIAASVVTLLLAATPASAAGPVTRTGSQYSGSRNPGGCEIAVDNGTDLHVKCTEKAGATGGAYIRFRFLKDVGGVRGDATTSSDVKVWVGGDRCAQTRWMGPIRTLRIHVQLGCYVHIRSVTWQQP
jgi:hypothetical protein